MISKVLRSFLLVRVVVWFVLSVGLSACQATTPAPRVIDPFAQERAKPPEDKPVDALAEGTSFKTFSSARFNFSLVLPDNQAFRIDDEKTPWFVATHAPTGSGVFVRSWREYEMMNRVSCEERARLHKDLPDREQGTVLDERRIDVPSQHDTMVEVRLRARAKSPFYAGTVLAFGGWARHCFAFVFATTDDDKKIVVARLSTIVQGTLERMKFDDPLVPRRTPPDLRTPLRLDPSGPLGP